MHAPALCEMQNECHAFHNVQGQQASQSKAQGVVRELDKTCTFLLEQEQIGDR
jgi:ABC-type taurine transport system substrate-binding protein